MFGNVVALKRRVISLAALPPNLNPRRVIALEARSI